MPCCPTCGSKQTVKNGHIHTGKQRFLCRSCGRQFVKDPANKVIDSQTRQLIDRLLLERLSMAGIARAGQVSEQWLQDYVNHKSTQIAAKAEVQPKKGAFEGSVRRALVVCKSQRKQAVGLVSARCRYS